jgi:hypothetical protein
VSITHRVVVVVVVVAVVVVVVSSSDEDEEAFPMAFASAFNECSVSEFRL